MLELKTIAELDPLIGQTVRGQYLLTGCEARTGAAGHTRLQLTLEDATESVLGMVWPEYRAGMPALTLRAPVRVTGEVRIFNGRTQLQIQQLSLEPVDAVACGSALLPLAQCPVSAQPALARLIALEKSLPEPLSGFLKRVVLDPRLGVPLLRCRASAAHHHAEVGGLLVHSTHVLDVIGHVAAAVLPKDPVSVHLAQLGYLLHDLGKLESVGEVCRPKYGLIVPHEIKTLLLLADHLHWLKDQDRGLAVALEYILGFVATPHKSRGYAELLVAELVVAFDQWSASTFNGRDLASLLRGKYGTTNKPASLQETEVANDAVYTLGSRACGSR